MSVALRWTSVGATKRLRGLRDGVDAAENRIARRKFGSTAASRRDVLETFTATLTQILFAIAPPALCQEACKELCDVSFAASGPFRTARLPKLEHTCTDCYPLCVGDRCLIRLKVTHPKSAVESPPPYPLAILSGGFLVKGDEYASYAECLASWGYVAVLYDKVETLMESLDDVMSVSVVREIMDWAQSNPLMQRIADTNTVYLIGHSRGGKLSVLAASEDSRIRSLCLIDPVDNTIYAPLGPGYPSALTALKSRLVSIPLLSIGSELGADCAPIEANFRRFYEAATGSAVEVAIREAGHFQFLDNPSTLDRAICLQGKTDDAQVRGITQALMVGWGEATIKPFLNGRLYRREGTTDTLETSGADSDTQRQPSRNMTRALLQGPFAALLSSTAQIAKRMKNITSASV